jgi:hypothetical protein
MERIAKNWHVVFLGSFYKTKYSSTSTNGSTLYATSSPSLTFSTEATVTPVKLPAATKATSTGKNAATSSPPMVKDSEPDLVDSSSAETRGIDQVREWDVGLTDQSPVWEETVG